MTETTTPEAPVTSAPVETPAQPTEQQPEAAVTTTTEPTPNPAPATEAAPQTTDADDLSDYWSKKGIDITTPEGQAQAAKSYREAEKTMHKKSQEAAELTKQLTDEPVVVDSDNPLVQDLASKVVRMERSQTINDFVGRVKLTTDQESTMATYLEDNPQKKAMVNAGLMTLDEVYTLSGAKTGPDPAALAKKAKDEAIQELADKQRAAAQQGSATAPSSTVPGDSISDLKARLSGVKF